MDNYKLNDFINSLGYRLPSGFDYNIGINKVYRFKDTNKKSNNKNLWITKLDDGVFSFGNWSTGEKHLYRDDETKKYNQEEVRANQLRYEQRKLAEYKTKKDLAIKLERYYNSLPYADSLHSYLINKGINTHPLIKQDGHKLIIPCYGTLLPFNCEFQTIQEIYPNGFKKFATGANASGSCLCLNNGDSEHFIFAEGFATCMSILELIEARNIKATIVCVFNCNGYKPVVSYFKKRYPQAIFELWADKDKHGIGEQKANDVAAATKAIVKLPPLTGEQVANGLSDWNDYISLRGVK